jgi:hypothetical protein
MVLNIIWHLFIFIYNIFIINESFIFIIIIFGKSNFRIFTFNYPSLNFKISPFYDTKYNAPSISAGEDKLLL